MAQSDFLDPRWQKFRLHRLELASWQCEMCGDNENTLHVHHLFYISGRKPWDYLYESTLVLCDSCHQCWHEIAASQCHLWEKLAAHYVHCNLSHTCYDLETLFNEARQILEQ